MWLVAFLTVVTLPTVIKSLPQNYIIELIKLKNLIKPRGKIIALLAFLPITPSLAAFSIFAQSVVDKRSAESVHTPYHVERVFEASRK